jgi:hypothetical protein
MRDTKWSIGIVEYWNDGVLQESEPNIPILHYSNIPILPAYFGSGILAESLCKNSAGKGSASNSRARLTLAQASE